MVKTSKKLEYYFDSNRYGYKEIQEAIENAKKDFPNKNFKTEIKLNDFGVYILTLYFQNEPSILNKINFKKKESPKKKPKEVLPLVRKYGQYKSTGVYRPI